MFATFEISMAGKFKGPLICLVLVAQFTGVLCEFHNELPPPKSAVAVLGDSGTESHHGILDCNDQSPAQFVVASASLETFKSCLQVGTPAFDKVDIRTGPFSGPLVRHVYKNTDLSPRLGVSVLRI